MPSVFWNIGGLGEFGTGEGPTSKGRDGRGGDGIPPNVK